MTAKSFNPKSSNLLAPRNEKDDGKVFVNARVRAKPAYLDEVKADCLALVAPSRAEKGCVSYNLYQSLDDPALFVFFEQWESSEHSDAHLAVSHATAFDRRTGALRVEEEEIIFLNPLDS